MYSNQREFTGECEDSVPKIMSVKGGSAVCIYTYNNIKYSLLSTPIVYNSIFIRYLIKIN